MESGRIPKVYRLRQLPEHLDRLGTAELLSKALGDISSRDVQIFSLATSVDPWERPPTRTATLMFNTLPALLETEKGKTEWKIKVGGLRDNLILDIHFLGFTPLNNISPPYHNVEYVIIPHLSNHIYLLSC